MVIQRGFFQYIYHIGCAFHLHSIINNGLIPGGQNSSKRQTVFFLPIDPRDKGHKDPEKIDLNVPRRAQYLHSAWKKHQDAVYWVYIDLAIRKGLTFYQTRSNAIILQGTLPARQPREEVARQANFFQPTQPIPKPICDRSGQPDNKHEVFVDEGETSWSLELRQICLEKSELSKLTIDQGNLINMKSHYEQPVKYIVRLRRSTPTMS